MERKMEYSDGVLKKQSNVRREKERCHTGRYLFAQYDQKCL